MSTVAPNTDQNITGDIELTGTLDLAAAAGGADALPRFSMVANSGVPMAVKGFAHPVVLDMKGAKFDKDRTPVLADHDHTQRIGHTTSQRILPDAIIAEGVVSSLSEAAAGFVHDGRRGFPFQVSVGARIIKGFFVPEGKSVTVNRATFKGPLVVVSESLIKELTVTVLGADSNTSVSISAKGTRIMGNELELENAVEARLADRTKRVERQLETLQNMPTVEAHAGEQLTKLRSEVSTGALDDAEFSVQLGSLMELSTMRATRPGGALEGPPISLSRGTAIHNRRRHANDLDELECALAMHIGMSGDDAVKAYGEQTVAAADNLGVHHTMDVVRKVADYRGASYTPSNKNSIVEAAYSTRAWGALLSNMANKMSEAEYRSFPQCAMRVARKLDANNFKEHTGIRLTGNFTMLEVPGDGELTHTVLDDANYTYSIATYGRMFGISRQDQINDDLNKIPEYVSMLTRGANLTIEEVFWKLVLANAGNFFDPANFNEINDTLSHGGLGVAVQRLLEQTNTDGKPINLTPRLLAVPPALKLTADELYTGRTLAAGGANGDTGKIPVANTFYGLYEPVAVPWLGSRGGIDGGADGHWILFAEPRDVAAFGIAFLDGRPTPTIEEAPQPFNQLGTQFRGYIDFGVCQIDKRGAVYSTGEGEGEG